MEAYCPSCSVNVNLRNAQTVRLKNGKTLLRGFCPICGKVIFKWMIIATISIAAIAATAGMPGMDDSEAVLSSGGASPPAIETVAPAAEVEISPPEAVTDTPMVQISMPEVQAEGAAGVVGEAAADVEQALAVTAIEIEGGREGSAALSEGGTYFATNAVVFAGGSYQIHLGLSNRSPDNVTAMLQADVPEDLSIKVGSYAGSSTVESVVPLEGNRWMLVLRPSAVDDESGYDMTIEVSVPVTAGPGHSTTSFTLSPLHEGDSK